jgi:hypothetical protein
LAPQPLPVTRMTRGGSPFRPVEWPCNFSAIVLAYSSDAGVPFKWPAAVVRPAFLQVRFRV